MNLNLKKVGTKVMDIVPDIIPSDDSEDKIDSDDMSLKTMVDSDIPPKKILNSNAKLFKNFRVIRRSKKVAEMKSEFIEQIQLVLDHFNKEDNEYDSEIVLFCCQVAEDWFITHPHEMGEFKKQAVILACKKYFNDNEKLVGTIIELVYDRIKPCTFRRRSWIRICNFFFAVACR